MPETIMEDQQVTGRARRRQGMGPFRSALLRGLGVLLPPLLTLVIFLWVAGTIQQYALEPLTTGTRNAVAWYLSRHDRLTIDESDIAQRSLVDGVQRIKLTNGERYIRLRNDVLIPELVYEVVERDDPQGLLNTGSRRAIYQRYVEVEYLRPERVIPLFLCIFILLLYMLGKFLAAGVGGFFWRHFERGISRLPLVRNVYGSVKQVTDFMLKGKELEYTRVVAVEYPRKGIWALGFVTGESLPGIQEAAGEPVLSLMIPSSPMSVTGYTITVLKKETLDLNLTIDQALQFVISCGVVVPPSQLPRKPRGPREITRY